MKTSRDRAWYFRHPDFDPAGNTSAGLQISPTGGVAMIEDDGAIRQALLLLLSTSPGERVMRPEYGCSLDRLVFAPNDESTAGLAIHFVRQAITRWEPRVDILHLDALPHPNAPTKLIIELRYTVKSTRRPNEVAFAMDLAGETP